MPCFLIVLGMQAHYADVNLAVNSFFVPDPNSTKYLNYGAAVSEVKIVYSFPIYYIYWHVGGEVDDICILMCLLAANVQFLYGYINYLFLDSDLNKQNEWCFMMLH